MKEKILALLRTSSDYISGQAICEKLGVSRTAVWKNINVLKAEGYIIDAVNNKGYRLVGEPDVVTKEKIEAALTTSVMEENCIIMMRRIPQIYGQSLQERQMEHTERCLLQMNRMQDEEEEEGHGAPRREPA